MVFRQHMRLMHRKCFDVVCRSSFRHEYRSVRARIEIRLVINLNGAS